MTKTKELTVPIEERYPALIGGANLLKQIQENMGGEEISPGDLVRIKVPSQGSTTWLVPTAEGEESCVSLEGIIVHITRRRAYWPNLNPTGDPPQCSSNTMQNGTGDPGGACEECKFNVFGSAKKPDGSDGFGKACKERKLIFLLREGSSLPDIVDAPPGSLKVMKRWQLSLQSTPYYAIVSRLELIGEKNRDGVAYAQIKPSKIADLPPEKIDEIRAYAHNLQSLFGAVGVEQEGPQEV